MSPCAFCQGPPIVQAVKLSTLAPFGDGDVTSLGFHARGYVFCHGCGAQGPGVQMFVWSVDTRHELLARALDAWETRDARNRALFDARPTGERASEGEKKAVAWKVEQSGLRRR